MGRRDPDPRLPIELISAEPSGPTDRQVVRTTRGGGRRPAQGLAVALGVVALASVGLVLGEDGGGAPPVLQERDNRARTALKGRPTTTTTDGEARFDASRTTVPEAPVLDQAVGASLLFAGEGEDWTLVDLDTGGRELVSIAADDPGQGVPVRNGVVVISDDRAVLHPLPRADPVDLGPGEQVLSSGLPDRVWIVDDARGFDGQPAGADARLVDLAGAVLDVVTLPIPYVGAATAAGLLFTQEDRTHLATPAGIDLIAPGPLLDASGELVLYLACDGPAGCRPEAINLSTGEVVSYAPSSDRTRYVVQATLAADGRLATTSAASAGDPGVVTMFADDGRVVIELEGGLLRGPVWLPTDRGLLMSSGAGRERVSVVDSVPQLASIPALDGVSGVSVRHSARSPARRTFPLVVRGRASTRSSVVGAA